MNRFSTFLIAVVLLMCLGEARAAFIVADARGDFVPGTTDGDPGILPATGTGQWRYLASDTLDPTLDPNGLDLLLWTQLGSPVRYVNVTSGGSANSVGIITGAPGFASDEVLVQMSMLSRPPTYTVLRWIAGAGEAGIGDIAGTMRHLLVAGTGDGSTLDIFADGVSLFSQFVAPNDTVGFAFNETATIGVGSTVDFVVGPNSTDLWDQAALKVTISASQVPEPSSIVLYTLGTVGLIAVERRRRKRNKAA